MKKKITRPDGTIEELEGTAEELAELERLGIASSDGRVSELADRVRKLLTDAKVALAPIEQHTHHHHYDRIPYTYPGTTWIGPSVDPFLVRDPVAYGASTMSAPDFMGLKNGDVYDDVHGLTVNNSSACIARA